MSNLLKNDLNHILLNENIVPNKKEKIFFKYEKCDPLVRCPVLGLDGRRSLSLSLLSLIECRAARSDIPEYGSVVLVSRPCGRSRICVFLVGQPPRLRQEGGRSADRWCSGSLRSSCTTSQRNPSVT